MTVFPTLSDLLDNLHVVSIPMRVTFRGIMHREAALFEGPYGWGEFSPFLEYGPQEASAWLASGIEAAWEGFPEPLRSHVPVNATVPAVPSSDVVRVLENFDAHHTVKIKVAEHGQSLENDLARVAEVRKYLPEAALRIDANAGWSVPEAFDALQRLAEYNLQYAEQPVAGIEGLAWLRSQLRAAGNPTLIAADESVRKATDPLEVARAGAADLLVIKAAPLGGVRNALRIVREAGMPAVISSALDTSVGLSAGVALAAALPELPFACGLGTGSLMTDDVAAHPLLPRSGALDVRKIEPDQGKLRVLAASEERRSAWVERIRAVHEVLVNNS
ncbi:O-succinylbenzoate synthase [Neomicrococcus aestuarii]|uniref:o-succinylbenzoate synthase n=1 Tax=Neomicrococcus aestuarii TaxID=556325 RepID=A0A7W8TUX9_9MICC|nr:o-succinylbenzoate synthase [Neomicrococcus aestuarii]MBB5513375.1 O-succinylbenzoate synthase [Neomicrococcus aestuarii]